jgi:hypothetical protein
MRGCYPMNTDKSLEERIVNILNSNPYMTLNNLIEKLKEEKLKNNGKEQYKKFHCVHCGKSTTIDVGYIGKDNES